MTSILRRIHLGGALEDILILLLLLIYSPTIICWVVIVECVCKMREYLFYDVASSHTKELVRRASIGLVIILSTPILVFNTLLIAAIFWLSGWTQ
jgi:uncharacterized membrane protein